MPSETMSILDLLTQIRQRKPLIHHITNPVAAPLQANALSALGASPMMANAPEEVAEITTRADALLINLGMLNRDSKQAMQIAMQVANQRKIPIVFDPVGVGASTFRRQTATELLAQNQVSLIRANVSELATLLDIYHLGKGIDAGNMPSEPLVWAKQAAERYACTIAITGASDYVSDGISHFRIDNGHPLMASLVGTGCTVSSVIATFLAVSAHNIAQNVSHALAFYGLCGETAAQSAQGVGSLQTHFLDALSQMPSEQMSSLVRITSIAN